jgi:FkbM family methyltransferase
MKLWPKRSSRDRSLEVDDAQAFLDFVSSGLSSSYAQRFQDMYGLWENNFATEGYFVEFGVMGGIAFSNTYVMEKVGWDGVVSEPHPGQTKRVQKARSCTVSTKCVHDSTGDTITFHAVKGRPALSTIQGFGTTDERSHFREEYVAHEVETITLNDLLDEAGAPDVVDFLSIDTEGSEAVILRAYDFERRPIRALVVEHNDVQREELYELLTGQGYRRKWTHLSGHDDWYVHRDLELPERSTAARDRLLEAMRGLPPFETQYEERVRLLGSLRD